MKDEWLRMGEFCGGDPTPKSDGGCPGWIGYKDDDVDIAYAVGLLLEKNPEIKDLCEKYKEERAKARTESATYYSDIMFKEARDHFESLANE